jgi:RNA polymerase sigma-70 factor (ECF subfamily)
MMNDLNDNPYIQHSGPFEARYLAFLETVATLRPSLHRYCTRMTGSVMDGEDVVQKPCSRPIESWTNSMKAVL